MIWQQATWNVEGAVAGSSLTTLGNVALHVNDVETDVLVRRQALAEATQTKAENWLWLDQTHSSVVALIHQPQKNAIAADGVVTQNPELIPVVMTADCVPVLFYSAKTATMAAIHAGWRGIYNGILTEAMQFFKEKEMLSVWIGPHIRGKYYQVDSVFRERFIVKNRGFANAFQEKNGSIYADLAAMVQISLTSLGVERNQINDSGCCSYEQQSYFSYRQEGDKAGRFASFVIKN